MKRFIMLGLLGLSLCPQAKEITGKVTSEKRGLPSVVVTDGYRFTTTDSLGNYHFEADDKAHFVYIVTPSGYMADCRSGSPAFYKPIDGTDFNFDLIEWGFPTGNYALFAVADTQPRDSATFSRLKTEAFSDMGMLARKYIRQKSTPVLGLFLGDIVFDRLDFYPQMKEEMRKLGFPVYPVIGNHDHDQRVGDDDASAHVYRQYFGPTYYAFRAGQDYFIVLDDILYKGRRKYDVGISEEQRQWVKDYLQYVPKGSHIFLAMHAPAKSYSENYKILYIDELLDLFDGYRVDIVSGHNHVQCNSQVRPNIREYNISCVGGPIWLWDSPLCKDGTPNGYQVFEVSQGSVSNYFKASGYPEDYQFKVFPMGTVQGHEDEICIKCWNYDERWTVEWEEDGKKKGRMTQLQGVADPDYTNYLNSKYLQGYKRVSKGTRPSTLPYFFFSLKPSDKAKEVLIKVTDPYGKTYEQKIGL